MGGSEFGGSRERESREQREEREHAENNERDIDPEDIRRMAKEMVEAAEKGEEWEPEERDVRELAREWIEDIENESRNEEREANDEVKGEDPEKNEDTTNKEAEPQKEPTAEDVEKPVKDAVDELARQEEELRTQREEREAREVEKQEAQERDCEERAENADKDKYDELEEWIIDTLEKHGVDPEELRERWREKFVEEMMDELEGRTDESEPQEDETQEDGKSLGEGKTQGSSTSYEDGSGQMYAMEHESSESLEVKQESKEVMEDPEETQSATSERSSQETKEKSEHHESTEKLEEAQKESDKQEIESSTHEERIEDPEKQKEDTEKQEPSETSEIAAESKKKEPKETPASATPEKQEGTSEKTEEPRERSETGESGTESESKEDLEDSRPTPMFPAGTPKIGTIWRESRREKEQSWDEYVDKKWEELTEEEKEEFKKKIRSKLEDMEDLEEVLKRHELEHLLDNDEVMEEISRYLEFHKRLDAELEKGADMKSAIENIADELEIEQETASKWAQYEDLPAELRELMTRETQWLWHQRMRWIAEIAYPTTLEEIDDSLDSETKKIVEAWLEIREIQMRREIEFIVKNGEELYSRKRIRNLSLKYGISEHEILCWLRGWSVPSHIREMMNRMNQVQRIENPSDVDYHTSSSYLELDRIYQLIRVDRMSEQKAAYELGVSRNQIRKALRNYEIRRLYYEEGLSQRKIAQKLHISRYRIMKIFRENNWPLRTPISFDNIDRALIFELYYKKHLTQKEISTRLKISQKRIARIFRDEGWIVRPPKPPMKTNRDTVLHLYIHDGYTYEMIAEELDISLKTIRRIFKERDIKPRKERKRKADKQTLEIRRKRTRVHRMQVKQTRDRIFGTRCISCGSDSKRGRGHNIHRKDGTEHDRNLFRSTKRLESLNSEEWALLCDRCHLGVHLLMNVFGYEWNDIEYFISHYEDSDDPQNAYIDLPTNPNSVLPYPNFEGDANELRKIMFGEKCALCELNSHQKSPTIHRKDGTPHHPQLIKSKKNLQSLIPEEWIALCHNCHNIVHWALDVLGLKWNEVKSIIGTNQNKL